MALVDAAPLLLLQSTQGAALIRVGILHEAVDLAPFVPFG